MSEKKVLIAYGTRYGSARITAQEIDNYLSEKGYKVDLVDLKKQKAPKVLGAYDLVVAGSSIAMFMWMGKVKGFLRKCRKSGISPAVYINCGMAIEESEKARERFLNKGLEKVGIKPVAEGIFGPVLDFRPGQGLPEGLKNRIKNTIKAMVKDKYDEQGLMDMRDQQTLDVFQKTLEDLLK